MKYSDKLKNPKWQKKRLKILEDRDWACELCCDKESTLHVHHTKYDQNKEPWEYEDYRLRVLCDSCHDNEHKGKIIDLTLSFLRGLGYTNYEIDWIILRGFYASGAVEWDK